MSTPLHCFVFLAVFVVCGTTAADWPPERCGHVQVLGAGDDDQVVQYDNARVEDADNEQLNALANALNLMPEVLCLAVRRVAFINRPPDSDSDSVVDAWTNRNEHQDLVYLNTSANLPWHRLVINRSRGQRATGIARFIHEATHVAIRMLQSQQKAEPFRFRQARANPELWPSNALQIAKDVIKRNRLETGVVREWERMHAAFVAAGMAQAYVDSGWSQNDGANAQYLASAGWMSAYGGEQAIEDIAEMTSWAIIRGVPDYPEDNACQYMNSQPGPSIDKTSAAIFTKLGFVRTLGFISEEHYQSCIGRLAIETSGDGFHSYKSSNRERSYSGNPRAGIGRGRGIDQEWLFATINADGTLNTTSGDIPVTVSLQLNVTPPVDAITDIGKRAERLAISPGDVSYPRGVYLIGARYGTDNRLQFTRQSDSALVLDVGQGVALIGRSDTDGIEGSIAIQRTFNYSGGLLSAIAGDEPVKEPTKVTFRYQPQ